MTDPARLALGLIEAAKRCLRKSPDLEPALELLKRAADELKRGPAALFGQEPLADPPPEIAAALELWLRYKAQRHEPYTPLGLQALYEKLAAMGPERAMAAVKHSMAMPYKGIVEPPKNGGGNGGAGRIGPPPGLDKQSQQLWWENYHMEAGRRARREAEHG